MTMLSALIATVLFGALACVIAPRDQRLCWAVFFSGLVLGQMTVISNL